MKIGKGPYQKNDLNKVEFIYKRLGRSGRKQAVSRCNETAIKSAKNSASGGKERVGVGGIDEIFVVFFGRGEAS